MLIVRGDAQTLPSELNTAATGEVWFDPILPKTDGVDVGTVVFSPNGRTVWHQHEHGQLLQITSGYGFVCKEGESPQRVRAGDTVWIANDRHWHGATSRTLISHTTTTIGKNGSIAVGAGPVPARSQEARGRQVDGTRAAPAPT